MSYQFFCDESGINSDSKVIAVGLLSTNYKQRQELKKLISQSRINNSCFHEMHFKSMSKKRYNLYLEVLKHALDYSKFYCGVIDKAQLNTEWFGKKDYITLNYFTKKVVARFANPGMNGVLYLDQKARERKDNGLDYLLREVNFEKPYALKKVEAIDSKANEFIQVCDLLTGLSRLAFLRGVVIYKNPKWDFTPSNRKEELLIEFLQLYSSLSGRRQLRFGRVWVWQPQPHPGLRIKSQGAIS